MKNIQFSDPHRQKHFDFFRGFDQPHFNITANVDITNLITFTKAHQFKITPLIVYFITRTAMEIEPFCYRIRGDQVVCHENLRPSCTFLTEQSDVFSFCTVPYQTDMNDFYAGFLAEAERIQSEPSLEDDEGADDYLFLSAFPWVSFTGFQHAMDCKRGDSVPRISWGKFFEQNGSKLMPLSVQAHHAVVDGKHIGAYFQCFEKFVTEPEKYYDV